MIYFLLFCNAIIYTYREIFRRIREFENKESRLYMTNVDKYRMKYLFFRLKILFLCINLLIMWKSSNFIYIFRCFQTINNIL